MLRCFWPSLSDRNYYRLRESLLAKFTIVNNWIIGDRVIPRSSPYSIYMLVRCNGTHDSVTSIHGDDLDLARFIGSFRSFVILGCIGLARVQN